MTTTKMQTNGHKKSEAAAARVVWFPALVHMRERGKEGSGKCLYPSTDAGIELHGLNCIKCSGQNVTL